MYNNCISFKNGEETLKLLISGLLVLVTSCAVKYDKKREVTYEKNFLGEITFKHGDKMIDKLDMVDQLEKDPKTRQKVEGVRSEYNMALILASVGGFITGWTIVNGDFVPALAGVAIASYGVYQAGKADMKVLPLVTQDDQNFAPAIFQLDDKQSPGLVYSLQF